MKSIKDSQRNIMKTAMFPAGEKSLGIVQSDDTSYHLNAPSSVSCLEIKKEPLDDPEASDEDGDGMGNMIEIEIEPQQQGVGIPFYLPPSTANKNIIKTSGTGGIPNIDVKEETDVEMSTVVKIEPIDEADDVMEPHRTVPITEVKVEPPDEILSKSGESTIPTHFHEVPCTNIVDHVFKVEKNDSDTELDNNESTNLGVNEATHSMKPVDSSQNKQKAFKGTCMYCSKVFYSVTLYRKHVSDHKKKVNVKDKVTSNGEQSTFECHFCDKKFESRRCLIRHVRRHPEEKPFKCDLCNITYILKNDLDKHMLTHTEKEPFKCEVCSKCFIRKTYLNNHRRIHTGERPYECGFCKRNFVQKSTFIRHLRTHTGEKPYNCDVCDKTFASNGELHIHARMHTGDKPYKCEVCMKNFSTKSHFNNHARTHTGEKPFECDVCNKRFNTSTLRNAHIKIHSR